MLTAPIAMLLHKPLGFFVCIYICMTVCNHPLRSQSSNEPEIKGLEKRCEVLLKQKEMVIQENVLEEKLQHPFEVSQMR